MGDECTLRFTLAASSAMLLSITELQAEVAALRAELTTLARLSLAVPTAPTAPTGPNIGRAFGDGFRRGMEQGARINEENERQAREYREEQRLQALEQAERQRKAKEKQ
jgi:hypothetical protein